MTTPDDRRYTEQHEWALLQRGGGEGTVVRLPGGSVVHVAEAVRGPVRVAFRPATVSLFTRRPEGSPRNVWPGRVTGLELQDGEHVPADVVVFSAGIRPRDEIAREAGLAVGPRGGIITDLGLQTSDPNIYAGAANWLPNPLHPDHVAPMGCSPPSTAHCRSS